MRGRPCFRVEPPTAPGTLGQPRLRTVRVGQTWPPHNSPGTPEVQTGLLALPQGETAIPDRPSFTAEPASSRKWGRVKHGEPHSGSWGHRHWTISAPRRFSVPMWSWSLQPHHPDRTRRPHGQTVLVRCISHEKPTHSVATRDSRETVRQVRRPSTTCRDATSPSQKRAVPDS